MYYPDEVVQEVLHSTNIVDVISPYVHLQKRGANYFGLCPFHNEKTPSFSVSPQKQIFYCFGCGQGGNAATFLMRYENCGFQEAVQKLAERAGITLPQENRGKQARILDQKKERLLEVNKEAAIYYYRLLRSPAGEKGLRYLRDRQLTMQTIHSFGLGYADGASSDLCAYLKEKGFTDEELIDAGIAAFDERRGLHDKFWNRVMFPIQDLRGRVIGFGGRVMGDGKPKYLNSPETLIFDKSRNLYGMNQARRSRKSHFILCEGYMDVIAMHQAGFQEACASLGTSFTTGQASLLKRYSKNIYLAYDSDGAGVRAAVRNLGILREAGMSGRVINMRPHKDPDEFIKALGPEAFQQRIDQAENGIMFEIRMMEDQYSLSDPDGRTNFIHAAAQRVSEIEDNIECDSYIKSVSAKYNTPENAFRKEVLGYRRAGMAGEAAAERRRERFVVEDTAGSRNGQTPQERKKAPLLRNERLLLTWLTDEPSLIEQVLDYVGPEDFEPGVHRQAAEKIWQYCREGKSPDEIRSACGELVSSFDTEEEQKEAAALFSTRLRSELPEEDKEKALRDLLIGVKSGSIERRNKSAEGVDGSALMTLMQDKKKLQRLRTLKIAL